MIEFQRLDLDEIWWMMRSQILIVISYLRGFKRNKVLVEEIHFQNHLKRKNLRLMNDNERRNSSSNKFNSRNFKRKKNSYERSKKKCESEKTSRVCRKNWRRRLNLTRRNLMFRMIVFSFRSISETKNFKIKEETSFQILTDIQTLWRFLMKSLIKWVCDVVWKEQTTTWALFQHNQSKSDWVKTQKSTLLKEFHQRWPMSNSL